MSKKTVNIGVFRRCAPGTSEPEKEIALNKTIKAAKEVQDYWASQSRGYWDVEVRGYVYEGLIDTAPPYYGYQDIREYMKDNPEFEDWQPGWYHVWGGSRAGICGQGRLPGNKSVTYFHRSSPCGSKTMCHELGHNFGLWHASSQQDGQDRAEYGDGSSIMGLVTRPIALNGPNLIKLGFYHDRELLEIPSPEMESRQVLLAPIELSRQALHTNEYQHLVFWDKGQKYHVSIRKTKGSRYSHGGFENALYIHKMPSTQSNRLLADLMPGQFRALDGGTIVRYEEYGNEQARVSLIVDGKEPATIPMQSYFPPTPAGTGLDPKFNGLWYNPDFNGEGFDVQIKGDKAVVYWFTYNQSNYLRRFYWAEGSFEDFERGVTLYKTVQGTWNSPTDANPEVVGYLQMYFIDKQMGVVNWDTNEHGRGSLEITPVQLSNSEKSGIAYDTTRNGEGFTIQYFDNDTRCTLLWYTYRKSGGPEWYYCEGFLQEDGSYNIVVYQAQKNLWMQMRDGPGLKVVGQATLHGHIFIFNLADGSSDSYILTNLF